MRYLENGVYEVYTPDNKRFEISKEDLAYLLKEFDSFVDFTPYDLASEFSVFPSNDCCDNDVYEATEHAAKYILDNFYLIPKDRE